MKKAIFIFRIFGFIVFGIIGFYVGFNLSGWFNLALIPLTTGIIGTLVFAVIGFVVTPYISLYPLQYVRTYLTKVSSTTLLIALIGLLVGLIIAALVTIPISKLPSPLSNTLPFVAVVLFGYLGVVIAVSRQHDFGDFASSLRRANRSAGESSARWSRDRSILIDTSVIIDGRIADIAKTGFLPGTMIIPRFVLNELQYIADSPENLRRQRGRRGMEVVAALQKDRMITVNIADIDVDGVREVDEKLVVLARQMRAPILTNDYNLNRVADLQGVQVLNINDLANAVKSILLPGEVICAKVIQEGKEPGQGVAYLDDGTMVVVEDGKTYLNKEVQVTVTKVLQTAAGRMIFSKVGNTPNGKC